MLTGFQAGRIKCLNQTWNISNSLYAIKALIKLRAISGMSEMKAKSKNIASSMKNQIMIYESIIQYNFLLLAPPFFLQNTIKLSIDNFEKNQNIIIAISRTQPEFQQGLTLHLSSFQYLQYPKSDLQKIADIIATTIRILIPRITQKQVVTG